MIQICVLFLMGCSQTDPFKAGRVAPVHAGLVMIPLDQVHLYADSAAAIGGPGGASIPGLPSAAAVQHESPVEAIQFNRYADPARPNELMHEAHVVYRRGSGPRWRLKPASARDQILFGPQLTDGRGEIQTLAAQEMKAFLHEQRAAQNQQNELIGGFAESVQRLAAQQQTLAEEIARLKHPESTTPDSEGRSKAPAGKTEKQETSLPPTPEDRLN